MTLFIIACAVMVLAALAFIAWPFIRAPADKTQPRKGYAILVVLAILIPASAAAVYAKLGRVHWQEEMANATSQKAPSAPDVEAMIAKLEQRLRDAPTDIDGWLMLGRSYMTLEKSALALNAYQKAYDLNNDNSDAALGLGEALMVVDERTITGKAGQLFEAVLVRDPDNIKALWYGAVSALTSGNLPRAHERLQRMLVLGPPDNIRVIIERQMQDIEQQLKAAGTATPNAAPTNPAQAVAQGKPAQSQRALKVQVSLSPQLQKDLNQKTPLFVLARDPNASGPPLAAVRRAVGDLPLSVTITDRDAMMQGRGIGSVARVQVVARISKTGTPQAQPGDLYGEAVVDFAGDKPVNVNILIDRVASASGK